MTRASQARAGQKGAGQTNAGQTNADHTKAGQPVPRHSGSAPAGPERSIAIIQGEHHVSGDPSDVVTTLLGSCVSVCLHDPVLALGGMNHFLLPGSGAAGEVKYGVHAMELLINALLRQGAQRNRLRARIFGGANILPNLPRIGTENAKFARAFLRTEGIACMEACLGGHKARRLRYWPRADRAAVQFVGQTDPALLPSARTAKPAARVTFF